MALVHRAKLTHYFSPSKQHLGSFFRSLTGLYGEQRHCDLKIVAGGGGEGDEEEAVSFGTHQMVFAGCSSFVRELIERTTEGCSCEAITLYLPDYSADTVRNLLSILYTGTSIGDCPVTELKSLLETLKIDLGALSVKPARDGNANFPDVSAEAVSILTSENADVISQSEAVLERRNAAAATAASAKGADASGEGEGELLAGDESNDAAGGGGGGTEEEGNTSAEMQLAPEVQMFLGNHFLADAEEDGGGGKEGGAGEPSKNGGNSLEQAMAQFQKRLENGGGGGERNSDGSPNSGGGGGGMKQLSHQMGMAAAAAAAAAARQGMMMGGGSSGGGDPPELDSRYSCRLCGKVSGNGASLFAHLLYPHYAHLWRDDVPHRAPRYDCKECSYSTVKRQHFVMHVARVHDELRKKLAALGENLEVLDNLTQKGQNNSNERIPSKIAKGLDGDSSANTSFGGLGRNSPAVNSGNSSPNAKDFFNNMSGGGVGGGADDSFGSLKNFAAGGNFDAAAAAMAASMRHQMAGGAARNAFKPFVKCRLCGKSWKGKDNFFTHLVSTHFKYLWAKEVPRSADMYHCHVPGCTYQSKYRYNFLFHLAGKHKQLKQKLAEEGIPDNVLIPIETDGSEFGGGGEDSGAGAGFPDMSSPEGQVTSSAALLAAAGMGSGGGGASTQDIVRHSKMMMQQQQRQHQLQRARMMGTTPPSALKGGGRPSGSSQNNTRLICRVCSKVSLNHTCHRQHVVGKHFYEFWAHLTADGMGIFNCHHPDCTYKTPNRSVFIIHLAYVHQELKNKLIASGRDPTCATPDVYGKRKYRRQYYDNTQHRAPMFPDPASLLGSPGSGADGTGSDPAAMAAAAAAAAAQRDISSLVSQQQAEVLKQLASQFGGNEQQLSQLMGNGLQQQQDQLGSSPDGAGASADAVGAGEVEEGGGGQEVEMPPPGVNDVQYEDGAEEEEEEEDPMAAGAGVAGSQGAEVEDEAQQQELQMQQQQQELQMQQHMAAVAGMGGHAIFGGGGMGPQ